MTRSAPFRSRAGGPWGAGVSLGVLTVLAGCAQLPDAKSTAPPTSEPRVVLTAEQQRDAMERVLDDAERALGVPFRKTPKSSGSGCTGYTDRTYSLSSRAAPTPADPRAAAATVAALWRDKGLMVNPGIDPNFTEVYATGSAPRQYVRLLIGPVNMVLGGEGGCGSWTPSPPSLS